MSLALRRFEIVAVFVVAALCAYAGAVWYFSPASTAGDLMLVPQPQVLNEKQAILDAVVRSSATTQGDAIPTEGERLQVLTDLNNVSSTSPEEEPTIDEQLDVLQQLSNTN